MLSQKAQKIRDVGRIKVSYCTGSQYSPQVADDCLLLPGYTNLKSNTHARTAPIGSRIRTKPSVTRILSISGNIPGLAPLSMAGSTARSTLPPTCHQPTVVLPSLSPHRHPPLSQHMILAATVANNFPTSQLLTGKHVACISIVYISLANAINPRNSFVLITSANI